MSKGVFVCAAVLWVLIACGDRPGEAPVTGVVFFTTEQLEALSQFYVERVGAELWMDQGDCRIFRHGQFLFGFCERERAERCGVLTFVYPDKESVDRMYDEFRDEAQAAPRDNPNYPIYNFFASDPDDRLIEFQVFTGPVDWSFAEGG